MSKKNKDLLVLGFALFSMFFGAGNLIFPPYLGIISSHNWFISVLAFILTDVGLTMFGVIITSKFGGNVNALCEKVSRPFAVIFGTLCMIAIGPLLAIPRTAATTYEIFAVPIFGNSVPPLASSIVFFGVTLFFVLNESSTMDRVGKILTPILLIMIFLIVIKAILTPIGSFAKVPQQNFFLIGFNEGYQTMDALGSIFMAGIVIKSLIDKGYTSEQEKFEMGTKTAIISGIGLAVVYISLAFVGATSSSVVATTNRGAILTTITDMLWGKIGIYTLGVAMLMACLTTSIGLTSTVASFFETTSNGKLPYKIVSIVICVFSTITSIMGLEKIISIAVPILITMYPMLIALIFLHIFDKFIKRKAIYQGAVFGAFLIGISQAMPMLFKNSLFLIELDKHIKTLPFSNIGMPFIIPSILCSMLFLIFVEE